MPETAALFDQGDDDKAAPALRAVHNEVAGETGDARIPVTLSTVNGEHEFRVPPQNKWRATARSALMSRGDSLMWAALTLDAADAQAWQELDPDGDETEAFFEEFGRAGGMDFQNRASRRSSGRTR